MPLQSWIKRKINQWFQQKENESSQSRLENEIKNLTSIIRNCSEEEIVTSIIFRKLVNIAERSTNCNEPLLTEQLWFSIVSEITETYPNLKCIYQNDTQIYQVRNGNIVVYACLI